MLRDMLNDWLYRLRALILRTVALGPRHGWAISERIQQVSQDVLRVPFALRQEIS